MKHTRKGIVSLISGIIGIILIINWIDILPNLPPLVLGIIALIFGRKAKKLGDSYGNTGNTLGIIATIIGGLQVIAWFIYYYISMTYFL